MTTKVLRIVAQVSMATLALGAVVQLFMGASAGTLQQQEMLFTLFFIITAMIAGLAFSSDRLSWNMLGTICYFVLVLGWYAVVETHGIESYSHAGFLLMLVIPYLVAIVLEESRFNR